MRDFDLLEVSVRHGAQVHLIVNGFEFLELVRQVELPFALADEQPDLAGAYECLWPELMLAPSMHLLGTPDAEFSHEGKPFLLGCTCGIAGCWPLFARVEVGPDTVRWSEFEHGFRNNWRYDSLGPFVFQRSQYETALGGAPSRWRVP